MSKQNPPNQTSDHQITPNADTQTADLVNNLPHRPKKRPPMQMIGVLIVVIFLGVIAFGLFQSYAPKAGEPSLVHKKSKQAITLQGRVEAKTTNISTKLPSRIDTIYVKAGQSVKAGESLVRLLSPEIEAKKSQAAAMLQSALAMQSATNRGTRAENVESLYANWQSAVAQATLATDTYQRGEYLYQEGVISRQRRDEMYAAQASAQALAKAAHQQYLKAERGRTDEQKTSAEAQVALAKAAVAEAAALEEETLLLAPYDGVVSKIYAQPSELVMPAVPVLSLLEDDTWVSLTVREDYYAAIYQQKTLTGFIPALNRTADFHIHHIETEGDFATIKNTRQTGGYDIRSFKMELTPVTPMADLKVGMSVVFELNAGQ